MNNHEEYNNCKTQLERIYKVTANGMKIRSKCEWLEHYEKSSKNILNIENSCAIQGQVWTVIYSDKEANYEAEINGHIYCFLNYFYKETSLFNGSLEAYRNAIKFPKITKKRVNIRSWINSKRMVCCITR